MWVYFNVDFRFSPVARHRRRAHGARRAAPIEGVADDPKPNVICYDFAKDGRDSFAYYAVRYWLTDLPNDDPTSSRDPDAHLHRAAERAGIPLARPAQTLFLTREEPEAARLKRHQERRPAPRSDGVELFHALTPEERGLLVEHLRVRAVHRR